MPILSDVGIILVNNNRSRAYLQRMRFRDLRPGFAIVLLPRGTSPTPGQRLTDTERRAGRPRASFEREPEFAIDVDEHCVDTLISGEIPYREISVASINDPAVVDALSARPERYWICSPPGGSILKRHLFDTGKQFLHVHPGLLPDFRGSTTIYYSLLAEGACGASAIFLDEKIDTGPVITSRRFPVPGPTVDPDYLFDPLIRSELLVEVLLSYQRSGTFHTSPQSPDGHPYFIIHPVLKHIVRLAIENGSIERQI